MDNKNKLKQPLWKGSWLGCILEQAQRWSVYVNFMGQEPSIELVAGPLTQSTLLIEVTRVQTKTRLLWSKIIITTKNGTLICAGVWRWSVKNTVAILQQLVTKEIELELTKASQPLEQLKVQANAFLASDRYLRHSDIISFNSSSKSTLEAINTRLLMLLNHPFAKDTDSSATIRCLISYINDVHTPKSKIIKERNAKFVEKELNAYADFFDHVEKTPLTNEQRHAAVVFEDRNLLVAAAGSGKSSTLIGKAGYAIHRGLFKPNEIITLAFNRKAAQELNERIKLRIKPCMEGMIKAHTFHGLGYSILKKLAKSKNKKIHLITDKSIRSRLRTILNQLIQDSPEFANNWMLFISLCREPRRCDNPFESFQDYERYIERQRVARRNGLPAVYQALTGDVVRSAQELAIANWLYINGIPFIYEKSFSPCPEGWNKYEPDFYLPEVDVWYEHFALDARGKAPSHFLNYAEQAQIKRAWMSLHATDNFIETCSYQYYEETLFSDLTTKLKKLRQQFRPRPAEEVLKRIQSLGQSDALDLVIDVLNLVKSNAVSQVDFAKCMDRLQDPLRAKLFTKVFWPLHKTYSNYLRTHNKVDFNDMIIQAAEALEQGQLIIPYQFVLVDEFQDISIGRARFIKAMLKQHPNRSVLFGVGDDWQAINGFAGSDLRLFMNFESYFGATHESLLTKTFRCPQGIADVSAKFIQENKEGQKVKSVVSELDSTIRKVVDLRDITKDEDLANELGQLLSILAADQRARITAVPRTKKYSVFLLSRYSLEKTKGINEPFLNSTIRKYSDALDINFTTIHKSKGLEADYVFLLGLNAGMGLTFPSTMANDPLIDVLLHHDPFPDAEERRLFYVALTRAKRQCFVFFRKEAPSPFVLALMDSSNKNMVTYRTGELPKKCSTCGKGFMIKHSGPWGAFLGCTRFKVGNCKNKIQL
ncbi:UvrD-helicase domain-containing protein [Aeromonas caviae]|uniref:UvrD-helicase domain-containing protein n=1 Tax=Aeromonas caviae TaxID=648 RepID=UPI002B4A5580|nr:UvrD-helicase domain-containing protein [Aeromonas caviae]